MSAFDFILSQNLHRRHFNIAQRDEIGLLLLAEEKEKEKAKERQAKIASEVGKVTGKGQEKSEALSKSNFLDLLKK